MKKIIITFVIATFFMAGYAQEPKGSFMYCEIVGKGRLFSNKVTVEIDFRQALRKSMDESLKKQ